MSTTFFFKDSLYMHIHTHTRWCTSLTRTDREIFIYVWKIYNPVFLYYFILVNSCSKKLYLVFKNVYKSSNSNISKRGISLSLTSLIFPEHNDNINSTVRENPGQSYHNHVLQIFFKIMRPANPLMKPATLW